MGFVEGLSLRDNLPTCPGYVFIRRGGGVTAPAARGSRRLAAAVATDTPRGPSDGLCRFLATHLGAPAGQPARAPGMPAQWRPLWCCVRTFSGDFFFSFLDRSCWYFVNACVSKKSPVGTMNQVCLFKQPHSLPIAHASPID